MLFAFAYLVLGWRGEDADRVAVTDPAGVSGGQLEEPTLLPDERGSSEGVVLLPGEEMPAQHGERHCCVGWSTDAAGVSVPAGIRSRGSVRRTRRRDEPSVGHRSRGRRSPGGGSGRRRARESPSQFGHASALAKIGQVAYASMPVRHWVGFPDDCPTGMR